MSRSALLEFEEVARLKRAGQLREAEAKFDLAAAEVSGDPRHYDALARGLVGFGRLQEAETLLTDLLDALKLDPYLISGSDHRHALTRLGSVQIRRGRLPEAVRTLEAALEHFGDGYAALQLANALRYLGDPEAEAPLGQALRLATDERDGTLAIATHCAFGESALDRREPKHALESFGKALGITEFSGDEALTIAPLAGLAQTHAALGNRGKGRELAERALARARRSHDRVGSARALLSLGLASQSSTVLNKAVLRAAEAPHKPLELKARLARFMLDPSAAEAVSLRDRAAALGMQGELQRLESYL